MVRSAVAGRRIKIARSFNCGFDAIKSASPGGAAEFPATVLSAAPAGLDLLDGFLPAVKTAGYFRSSLCDGKSIPAFA
jgi:hypothetical protein